MDIQACVAAFVGGIAVGCAARVASQSFNAEDIKIKNAKLDYYNKLMAARNVCINTYGNDSIYCREIKDAFANHKF
jgi:hypothetical protein